MGSFAVRYGSIPCDAVRSRAARLQISRNVSDDIGRIEIDIGEVGVFYHLLEYLLDCGWTVVLNT